MQLLGRAGNVTLHVAQPRRILGVQVEYNTSHRLRSIRLYGSEDECDSDGRAPAACAEHQIGEVHWMSTLRGAGKFDKINVLCTEDSCFEQLYSTVRLEYTLESDELYLHLRR